MVGLGGVWDQLVCWMVYPEPRMITIGCGQLYLGGKLCRQHLDSPTVSGRKELFRSNIPLTAAKVLHIGCETGYLRTEYTSKETGTGFGGLGLVDIEYFDLPIVRACDNLIPQPFINFLQGIRNDTHKASLR